MVDPVTGELVKKPAGQILREAGYSESVARNPKQVLESIGFREILAAKGLTTEYIGEALHADIEAKPGRRVRELELAAKMTGLLKDQSNVQVNITLEDILAPISQQQANLQPPDREIGQVIEMPRQ